METALKRENIETLKDIIRTKKIAKEAFEYGKYRGECSAVGDRYGTLGGPRYDDVLKDYLREKFGITGGLEEIALELPKIPKVILNTLREGFDEGYKTGAISAEDSDSECW